MALLLFTLGGRVWALPMACVQQVRDVEQCTWLPTAPPHFLGMVAFRGRVLPLVDLGLFFQLTRESVLERMKQRGSQEPCRMLIVRWQEYAVALAVEEILGAHGVSVGAGEAPAVPAAGGGAVGGEAAPWVEKELAWGETSVSVLRLEGLLAGLAIGPAVAANP